MNRHEFYSNVYSHLVTPEREVEGNSFHSNEQMTIYEVNFSHAVFPLPEETENQTVPDDTTQVTPTEPQRPEPQSRPKSHQMVDDKKTSPNPHFTL